MQAVVRAVLLLVAVGVLAAGVAAYTIASKGLSTRVAPSTVEASLARVMRTLATPSALRNTANPVPLTPEVLEDALGHFADHCATCHANNGSGETAIGQRFYPPAPDMRAGRTQVLSDGELFSIIEHGIRLTGMPAWGDGTAESARASWALVHFIRHLPALTADEVARMETLNPKSPAAFRDEEAARRFLAGEDVPAAPASGASHAEHR